MGAAVVESPEGSDAGVEADEAAPTDEKCVDVVPLPPAPKLEMEDEDEFGRERGSFLDLGAGEEGVDVVEDAGAEGTGMDVQM